MRVLRWPDEDHVLHPTVRQLLSGAVAFSLISATLAVGAPLTTQAAADQVPAQVTRSDIAVELFELAGAPDGPFPNARFVDVDADSDHATAIDWLSATGITTGRADGSFGPDAALSRAAFASMLYRLAGTPEGPFPAAGFADVATGSVHGTAIDWLAHTGLTVGRNDGTFGPSASVTRTQTATFTTRFTDSPTITIDVPDVAIPAPPEPEPAPAPPAPRPPQPPAATVSSAPLNLTVTPAPTELIVTWEPPTNDGGAAITGYTITITPDGGTTTTTTTAATISGLDNDTGYTVAVVATNAVGDSAPVTAPATTLPTATFFLADNGVTVLCPEAAVGDSGDVNGTTYTKRDRAGITVENAATTCTSGITDMAGLFSMATTFNQDIGHWDTANVTAMNHMFSSAAAFNQDIGGWDTANVTAMNHMFSSAAAFNQDIGHWNTANVTTMSNMFFSAAAFNQDIGGWNTAKVTAMGIMFFNAAAFNQDIGGWNTANVTTMSGTFNGAAAFNQDIGGWNTAKVISMSSMFKGAAAFNQDIGGWDTAKVISMISMFDGAAAFNQNLSGWCVGISAEPSNFKTGAAAWTNGVAWQPQWGQSQPCS